MCLRNLGKFLTWSEVRTDASFHLLWARPWSEFRDILCNLRLAVHRWRRRPSRIYRGATSKGT